MGSWAAREPAGSTATAGLFTESNRVADRRTGGAGCPFRFQVAQAVGLRPFKRVLGDRRQKTIVCPTGRLSACRYGVSAPRRRNITLSFSRQFAPTPTLSISTALEKNCRIVSVVG